MGIWLFFQVFLRFSICLWRKCVFFRVLMGPILTTFLDLQILLSFLVRYFRHFYFVSPASVGQEDGSVSVNEWNEKEKNMDRPSNNPLQEVNATNVSNILQNFHRLCCWTLLKFDQHHFLCGFFKKHIFSITCRSSFYFSFDFWVNATNDLDL